MALCKQSNFKSLSRDTVVLYVTLHETLQMTQVSVSTVIQNRATPEAWARGTGYSTASLLAVAAGDVAIDAKSRSGQRILAVVGVLSGDVRTRADSATQSCRESLLIP
jgi:hypothetical protein